MEQELKKLSEYQMDSALRIRAFPEPLLMQGNTYWDSHSRMFSIIRLPAKLSVLFPRLKNRKLAFNVLCFPDKKSMINYIEQSPEVSLLIDLYEREKE